MKKKIEQLLNGKFEYEQPQLLFSKEKISLTMKAGETKRGEVYVGTEDNQKIRGYVRPVFLLKLRSKKRKYAVFQVW